VRTYTQREYGNRVGIFRVMETLDRHGLRTTFAIDAVVAQHYPVLLEDAEGVEAA
jgi:allantoinase